MIIYFLVAILLISFSTLSIRCENWSSKLGAMSAILVSLFAGLRFQTGYDWPFYESYYASMVGIGTAVCDGIPRVPIIVEPMFMLLNILFKTFFESPTMLFFTISLFNVYSIFRLAKSQLEHTACVWMPYFGLVFLMAQMTMLRQGLASSFVILALIAHAEKRFVKSLLLILVGSTFHVSTIAFLPILLVGAWTPPLSALLAVLSAGVAILISGHYPHQYFLKVVSLFSPEWLAIKISFYLQDIPTSMSVGAMGLAIYHLIALVFFYRRKPDTRDRVWAITIWLTFFSLVGHIYFAGIATVWNRIMFVTVVWQTVLIYRVFSLHKFKARAFHAINIGTSGFGLACLVYLLSQPTSLPFIPYQSVFNENLGIKSHGDERKQYMLKIIGEKYPNSFPPTKLTQPPVEEPEGKKSALLNYFCGKRSH